MLIAIASGRVVDFLVGAAAGMFLGLVLAPWLTAWVAWRQWRSADRAWHRKHGADREAALTDELLVRLTERPGATDAESPAARPGMGGAGSNGGAAGGRAVGA